MSEVDIRNNLLIFSTFGNYKTGATLVEIIKDNVKDTNIYYFTNDTPMDSKDIVYQRLPKLSGLIYKDLWRVLEFILFFKRTFGCLKNSTSLIAIDNYCLVLAYLIKLFVNRQVTIVYLSFEIYLSNEIRSKMSFYLLRTMYWLCLAESRFVDRINHIIIQDKKRLEMLEQEYEYRFTPEKLIFLPLAIVRRNMNDFEDSDRYLVPPNCISVIYSGSYPDWSGLDNYLDYIQANPDISIYTVFHNRGRKDDATLKHREIFMRIIEMSETGKYPISYIIDYYEEMEDYIRFLKQFDVGLVSYADNLDNGVNMKYVGLASSKFCFFASIEMPMITFWNDDIIRSIYNKYPFGYCTTNISDIGRITRSEFISNVEIYKNNVNRLYDSILDPRNALEKIRTIIQHA